MNTFWKSFGLFVAGFATCALLIVGGCTLFYFVSMKPMMNRIANQGLRTPSFPADQRPAVLDGTWTKSDGSKLSLKEVRGKVVVLNVWATWCRPCMAELPTLSKLAAHYGADHDVKVICVTKEPVSVVTQKLRASEALSIAYSTDGSNLPDVYSTPAIPATFLIDRNGEIVFQHVGSADWSSAAVIDHIEKLRKERPNPDRPECPARHARADARVAPATTAGHRRL